MDFYEQKVLGVEDLIPYALNSRTHSDEQVAQLAASIREFGFTNPVLVDESNNLIAGHGRLLAARKLKLDQVPAVVVTGLDERKRRALVIADNKLALNAGWDEEALRVELEDLSGDFGELMGFSKEELDAVLNPEGATEDEVAENYSRKIAPPIYEPKGPKPKISDLYDDTKYSEILREIEESGLSQEERDFLAIAATRHIIFNFRNIAEYYAHSAQNTQDHMERSALVIIDIDAAIENGFVDIAEGMMDQVRDIKADENA